VLISNHSLIHSLTISSLQTIYNASKKVDIKSNLLKEDRLSEMNCFLILKVANIRCFILIAVEIFHNIIISK